MLSQVSKEFLKNCHETLKWIWVIVMALAVERAIETFIFYIDPNTGAEIVKDWQHIHLNDALLFIIFIVTIVRFYHGDSRYLDRTYLESQLRAVDPKLYSARNRFTDFYLLLIHAFLFYVLAASQRNFSLFFLTYTTLILFNSIWLGIMYLRAPNKKDVRYPRNWAINNIIHVCLFVGLYLLTNRLEASYSHIVFFTLVISNTFLDYFTTWPYYFPRVEEETQELPKPEQT
jgi:hypothetical protein